MNTSIKHIVLVSVLLSITSFTATAQDGMYQPATPVSNSTSLFGDMTNPRFQIFAGYVNKSWICSYEGHGTQREDFFGDPNDMFFHGFQMGFLYTPAFDWGLGLRTGLAFEVYISHSKWIRDWCTTFDEVDLYIPVHAMYRYSVNDDFGFEIFGGVSFQWAIDGRYYKWVGRGWSWSPYYWYRPKDYYVTEKQEYGNGWPKKVNWQADLGISFRYKMVALSFTYSFGIYDQGIENSFDCGQTFVTATTSRQDKIQASIGFVF